MDPIHIQPLVHEFFPEIKTVIGGIHNLLLKANKELLEIINLDHINSLLISQKVLILAIHNVLN